MNPYSTPSDNSAQSDDHGDVADQIPAALMTATATAVISLFVWTSAIICYVDHMYRPNMGFWVVILLGISLFSTVPVAAITFFASRLAITRSSRRYRLAGILFVLSVLSSPAIIACLHSGSLPLSFDFLILASMMWTPPCLLGFAASGVVISMPKSFASRSS